MKALFEKQWESIVGNCDEFLYLGGNEQSTHEWMADGKQLPHQDIVLKAGEEALNADLKNIEDLKEFLSDCGFEVRERGQSISVKGEGWHRSVRLDSLGKCFTRSALEEKLSGKNKTDPDRQVGLLIDIDAKLREGKGAGYRQWAAVFNAKQTAKAINYLRENRISDFDELTRMADESARKYKETTEKIRIAETRMSEIQQLKTSILNYRKTKAVFDEYKARRYSKQFREEHEGELILHYAAKKAFNEAGLKRLPTIKALQDEYGVLLSQKKRDYKEQISERDEMRQLQRIRFAVGKLLYSDNDREHNENEHDR